MTKMIKLGAAFTKAGIASASHTPENDVTTVTLKDGRTWAATAEDISSEEFVVAALAAAKYEAAGFEGIQPNELIRIEQADDGSDFVARLMVDGKPAGELARDPILTDLMETLEDEAGTIDQVEGIRSDLTSEDEDEERTGSVVPDVFKKRYAEAGHAGHCGDWLALTLNKLCQTLDGKKTITDLDRLETIAAANDVNPARVDKLGTATNGWQGRYRMTVRNMLAKKVADKGHLFVPEGCGVKTDTEMKAPKDWCQKYATKAKTKAVVAKDPGAGKASAKTKALSKQIAAIKPTDKVTVKGFNGRRAKADKSAVA